MTSLFNKRGVTNILIKHYLHHVMMRSLHYFIIWLYEDNWASHCNNRSGWQLARS